MYYVGIDLGGTKIAGGVVDENGAILYKESIPTLRERHQDEILKDLAQLVYNVIKNSGIDISKVAAVGVGSPGTPNSKEGTIVYTNNINFKNADIRGSVRKQVNLPVYVDNDANCAALAEGTVGAAKDVDHSITITLGTGIGGGVIINKKVYSGFNYAAAELGHMVLVVDGEECSCGRMGCWEAYASATALIRDTRKAALEHPESLINNLISGDMGRVDAKTAFDAARAGDPIGIKVVDNYIKFAAEGIINLINMLEPSLIVVGGGISKEGENLLAPLRKYVYSRTYVRDECVPMTQIVLAQMGNEAGIIGAAMLGKQ